MGNVGHYELLRIGRGGIRVCANWLGQVLQNNVVVDNLELLDGMRYCGVLQVYNE